MQTCLIICRKKSMKFIIKQLNKSLSSHDVILDSWKDVYIYLVTQGGISKEQQVQGRVWYG